MGSGVAVGTGVGDGTGVGEGVAVGTGVGVRVGTAVGVWVGSGVSVSVGAGEGVGEGEIVGVGSAVSTGSGVTVGSGVMVGVGVGAAELHPEISRMNISAKTDAPTRGADPRPRLPGAVGSEVVGVSGDVESPRFVNPIFSFIRPVLRGRCPIPPRTRHTCVRGSRAS